VRRTPTLGLAVVAVLAAATPVCAADDTPLLSFSLGLYDQSFINPGFLFFRVSSDKSKHNEAADFRGEYRFGTSLLGGSESWAKLKPWIGVEATSDGAVYGVGGILLDVPLGPFVLTPSFGAGLYASGGGKDLGYPIEFRTQLELGYAFDNQSRLSLAYSHISNANLGESNHGTNMISLYYHIPVGWLLGQREISVVAD
jgi:lipid A 3-O-deacylase